MGFCLYQDSHATTTISSGIDTKQTTRSPTARFSMKILTRFLRNSARLTMVTMTIALPSNTALPSNVSNISSETMETWNTFVLVQTVSFQPV